MAGRPLIFDFLQPLVERGSGDAKILDYFASGYLEGFHLPEDEKPLVNRIRYVPLRVTTRESQSEPFWR